RAVFHAQCRSDVVANAMVHIDEERALIGAVRARKVIRACDDGCPLPQSLAVCCIYRKALEAEGGQVTDLAKVLALIVNSGGKARRVAARAQRQTVPPPSCEAGPVPDARRSLHIEASRYHLRNELSFRADDLEILGDLDPAPEDQDVAESLPVVSDEHR